MFGPNSLLKANRNDSFSTASCVTLILLGASGFLILMFQNCTTTGSFHVAEELPREQLLELECETSHGAVNHGPELTVVEGDKVECRVDLSPVVEKSDWFEHFDKNILKFEDGHGTLCTREHLQSLLQRQDVKVHLSGLQESIDLETPYVIYSREVAELLPEVRHFLEISSQGMNRRCRSIQAVTTNIFLLPPREVARPESDRDFFSDDNDSETL